MTALSYTRSWTRVASSTRNVGSMIVREIDHAGRISKCGDGMVRSLLFEAAKVLLSRSARPSALKTWGDALGKRIGAKKATMAVARKLAVILHRMWTMGTTFQWNA